MIYYEKTDVKQYSRKTAQGLKSFNQLNLGYESTFEKGEEVVILKETDFNELLNKSELLEDLKKNNNVVRSELESLRSDNKKYSTQILELTGRINELENIENNYDKVIKELESLRTDNREYSNQILELTGKVKELENIENDYNQTIDELESVKSDNADYSNQILNLTGEVKELDIVKNNYDKAISELESLRTDNQELKSDKKKLSDKLNVANTELTYEKELKSNIVMKYEGIISEIQDKLFFRLLCTLPKSYKQLHESEIKEIVEVDNKGGK